MLAIVRDKDRELSARKRKNKKDKLAATDKSEQKAKGPELERDVFKMQPIMPTGAGEVLSPFHAAHRARMEQYWEAEPSPPATFEDEFWLPSDEDALVRIGMDNRLYRRDGQDSPTRGGGDIDNEYLNSHAQTVTTLEKSSKRSMEHSRRNQSRRR